MSQSDRLYDPIRKLWVADRPEERVRIDLLSEMVGKLGYPASLISVEAPLNQMAHLKDRKVPSRRLDIVIFAKEIHPVHSLFPLLGIECKAEQLGESVWEQLIGYNHYLGAPFLGIVSGRGVEVAASGCSERISWLPSYSELIGSL